MRPDPITITAGDKSFTIRPLTLGQIRAIDSILHSGEPQLDQSIGIVRAALARDYPDTDPKDLEIALADLGTIVDSILRVGGMIVDVKPGELQEVPQTGTSSTDA